MRQDRVVWLYVLWFPFHVRPVQTYREQNCRPRSRWISRLWSQARFWVHQHAILGQTGMSLYFCFGLLNPKSKKLNCFQFTQCDYYFVFNPNFYLEEWSLITEWSYCLLLTLLFSLSQVPATRTPQPPRLNLSLFKYLMCSSIYVFFIIILPCMLDAYIRIYMHIFKFFKSCRIHVSSYNFTIYNSMTMWKRLKPNNINDKAEQKPKCKICLIYNSHGSSRSARFCRSTMAGWVVLRRIRNLQTR